MKISIIQGDITKVKADAIVNAAGVGFGNAIGGGVAGAIRRGAGDELVKECQELTKTKYPHGLPTGEAVATKAYNLPAKIIIHTVGPRAYSDPNGLLIDCYENCLRIAEENKCKTIAFPAISTGAYGMSINTSAKVVRYILKNFKSPIIEEIILVLFKDGDKKVYDDIIIKKTDYEDALVNMDDMRFCRYCLATIGDVIPLNGDFWTCSEECSKNLLKKESKEIGDLISSKLKENKN
jgi:O-acetyl-ADP-ribose deacetylase (regulator of RNase III)